MGVRGLTTFIHKYVGDGLLKINMKEEVEDYKRLNKGAKPVILIDLCPFIPRVYTSNHELILGGRHEIYTDRAYAVLNALKSLDAELIFLWDGPFQPEKLDDRLERRNVAYMRDFEILQRIENGADLMWDFNHFDLTNPRAFRQNFVEIVVQFGELKICCLNYQEAVELANRINAFAIISWNSDFLIFGGKWRYWSARDIDFEKLTTLEYNKISLRLNLSLSEEQMPLFGTLGGSGFLAYKKVEQFHRNITRRGEHKFNAIAGYVRRLKSFPPQLNESDLETIYNDLFYGQDREKGALEFQNSLNFFSLKNMKFEYNNPILQQISQHTDKFAFKTLNGSKEILSLFFKNCLNAEFTTNEILIELIQKMMGVLLQSQNNAEDVERIMYCKMSHEEPYEAVVLKPIFPSVEVPSTLKLLSHPYGDDKELDDLRWDLLCSFISPKLERNLLLKIPKENLVEILTIFLLVDKKQIAVNEADSLLLACNCPKAMRNELQFAEVNHVKARDVELAYLFQKIFNTIKHGFATVGLQNFAGVLSFDGLYFHILRKQWSNGNHELTEIAIERFNSIRIYSAEFGLI